MAYIQLVSEEQATGLLQKIYRTAVERAGKVYNILRVQSRQPRILQSSLDLYVSIMFGESPLSRAEREMIAVVVSRANGCHY